MASWDDRADRYERHPILGSIGIGIAVLLIVFVLGVVFVVGKFALGWWSTAAKVAGPENVQLQYQEVIGDWNHLEQAAGNYCSAKNSKQGPNSPSLVEDPGFAYAATYRQVEADYDRRMNNIFEAGLVGPSGYPKNAPSLEEMSRKVCRPD